MKKAFLFALAFCFVATLAFAQTNAKPAPSTAKPVAEKTLALKGDIIDNTCANAHKDTLAEFVKSHTKQCAVSAGCIESGYSIFADGKLYKFDKDSSAKVAEFLKKDDSKLQVVVTAKEKNGELGLVSVENQK